MESLNWIDGDPPKDRRPRHRWTADVVRELRWKPGIWADVNQYVNPNTAQWARRQLRRHGCEASVSFDEDALYHVYARWPLP